MYRDKNPELVKLREHGRARPHRDRTHYLREKKYGVDGEAFGRMFLEQQGSCKICGEFLKKPHIDHCHTTGKVRGLLCMRCNTGIGMLRESEEIMNRAISYLRETA